ncbi:MAG: DUF3858 domain-containing protein [Candidatus Krumholzibacteria bacterium]
MPRRKEIIRVAKTQRERIRRLYDYVANQITYENLSFQYSAYIPEAAEDVLQALYGDCKDKVCLLRSMLKGAGVESYFVLVSPVTDGLSSILPSARFNHAILAIPQDDGLWFVDPTAKGMDADRLPESLRGARALVIKPGTNNLSVLPLADSREDKTIIKTDISVSGDDARKLVVKRRECVRSGDKVAELRSRLKDENQEQRQTYLATNLGTKIVGLKLLDAEWTGLTPGTDSVTVTYSLEIENALAPSGNLSIARIPWRSDIDRFFGSLVTSSTRREPLLLYGLQVQESETVRFTLPEGWKLVSPPESKELSCPYGSCTFNYAYADGALQVTRELSIRGLQVPPDKYRSFKEFLESVIREHEAVLVLQQS